MTHHVPSQGSRAGRQSVSYSTAREVLIWNVAEHPDEHAFPAQLEPGDMALNVEGDVYMYTGQRWHLLVPSVLAEDSADEQAVHNLIKLSGPDRLKVSYEDEH